MIDRVVSFLQALRRAASAAQTQPRPAAPEPDRARTADRPSPARVRPVAATDPFGQLFEAKASQIAARIRAAARPDLRPSGDWAIREAPRAVPTTETPAPPAAPIRGREAGSPPVPAGPPARRRGARRDGRRSAGDRHW